MGQFNQDFHGKFPPLHRPLSLRDESQPARGLWLFEQVSVVCTDQYISVRHLLASSQQQHMPHESWG